MEFALGVLHWTEDQFWRSTPYGLSCAYIGHCKSTGSGRWAVQADGWSDAEIDDFKEVEALLKAQHPGGEKVPREWKEMKRREHAR